MGQSSSRSRNRINRVRKDDKVVVAGYNNEQGTVSRDIYHLHDVKPTKYCDDLLVLTYLGLEEGAKLSVDPTRRHSSEQATERFMVC